jgi:hypothetical protein
MEASIVGSLWHNSFWTLTINENDIYLVQSLLRMRQKEFTQVAVLCGTLLLAPALQ